MADPDDPLELYTVRPGDTLSSIAKTQLGSAVKWRELFDENRELVGDEVMVLAVGLRLRLPRVGSPPPDADRRPWKKSE